MGDNDRQAEAIRTLPFGAEVVPGAGVHFRVWAPRRSRVDAVLEGTGPAGRTVHPLDPEGDGFFSGTAAAAGEGSTYRLRLDESDDLQFPDPASRYQPQGPLGPSQVVDPARYRWTDADWPGVTLAGQVLYEMHVGTFTPEGTWEAAARRLPELRETGITVLELMPVAEFAGRFGWGYDGVDWYAPTRRYGTPDDFRRFVDAAHRTGLGVVLDVVYNHFGPVGNFMREFSIDVFSERHETEWGEALNFDGPQSAPVRDFVTANAAYWIREYHLDGLRVDATQSVFDKSTPHILSEIAAAARRAAGARGILVIAENEPQHSDIARPGSEGGFGFDALWNDDFHHSVKVALTGRNEAYLSQHLGTAQELVSAARWGYLYQGQLYHWQNKRRGTPAFGLPPKAFVTYIQNHDQIANSGSGRRLHTMASPGAYRALTAFWLLIPGTPMLFQGQEFGASTPFLYFADHAPEMGKLVREGRAEFLSQFVSLKDARMQALLADPGDPDTFGRCKLDPGERERHPEAVALHRDLLTLRREDPVFRAQRADWMHAAVLNDRAFLLRFLGGEQGDRLLLVNLGIDLVLRPAPEPLLAPPEGSGWDLLWSSEAPSYGGEGVYLPETPDGWRIPGHAAVVLAPKKIARLRHG
jgi:maltooligosyltrehalose trehalohydrolase